MPYIKESLEKFNNLEPEIILTVDSDEVAEKIKKVAEKNNIKTENLSLAIIFLIVGDLKLEEIKDFFKTELEATDELASKITADFTIEIFNPLIKRLDFLNANPDKDMKIEEEEKIFTEIFSKDLLKEFNSHPIILRAIDFRFFYIFNRDATFRDELVRVLLTNEEILTAGTILADGKSRPATIGNWLKNFIEINGSEMFDSIVLARYLVDSKDILKLSVEDKEKVKKVLALYRNLKFFPESMPNDTGENWQIIPYVEVEEDVEESIPVIPEIKDKKVRNKSEEKLIAPMELASILPQDQKIKELKEMLNQYPPVSFERLAIEQEIKKLENKK